jgi:adenylosuccinate synthase
MKRATAVIGAAFGDEGKGLMVDYFCRQAQEKPIVVRYNGGAQAGHTVVTPEGKRHVFHHYGAGTFAGADTYLGPKFLVNPFIWQKEAEELLGEPSARHIYVHPDAPVTTVYDMFVNQKIEEARDKRHGSCGMGIHETMLRHAHPDYALYAGWLSSSIFPDIVKLIRGYALDRLKFLGLNTGENVEWVLNENLFDSFIDGCWAMRRAMALATEKQILRDYKDVVFEGAQGLLLDEDNKRFFPHVTHSKTGLHNVIEICDKAGISHVDACYVARSYLTRHGAGELPGEDHNLSYYDDTNQRNDWQGTLRFAPQNWRLIDEAIREDFNANYNKGPSIDPQLAITHVDQCAEVTNDFYEVKIMVKYESLGPTYKDVHVRESVAQETLLESHSLRRSELQESCSSLP